MASIFDGIDTTDPCLVWPILQSALYRLAAGEAEVRVRYEDFDVAVQPANQKELERLITRLRVECARKTGKRSRFAMRGGF
ncbi:MAG: hypothetical protein K5905_20355 [Roseibium sp.]|uniref:hypothetical protein n=1 Tax=Roseibium sp. TaxID=1936156 RepID=UPI00262C2CED|nr:hypothetical protein [Roseibium sp.]MCV0427816.1 hypothetical protein [Roseibium sp.]